MSTPAKSRLEQRCIDKGLKMTEQRRVIARVLSEAHDHPDVEAVHRRATAIDPRISIATVKSRSWRDVYDQGAFVSRDHHANSCLAVVQ